MNTRCRSNQNNFRCSDFLGAILQNLLSSICTNSDRVYYYRLLSLFCNILRLPRDNLSLAKTQARPVSDYRCDILRRMCNIRSFVHAYLGFCHRIKFQRLPSNCAPSLPLKLYTHPTHLLSFHPVVFRIF